MLLHIFLASDLLSFSDLVHLPNRALYWFRGYKLVSPTYTIARAPSLYCHICLGKDLLLCPPRFCIFFSVSLGGHRVSIFKSESSLYFRCISNSKMPLKDGRYCSAPQSNIAISCGPGLFLFNVCFFFFCFVYSGQKPQVMNLTRKKNSCGNSKKLSVGINSKRLMSEDSETPMSDLEVPYKSIFLIS